MSKKMEFAKYYNVTEKLNSMINNNEVISYQKGYCEGIFVCEDTHDFWVCRILKDINSEYETEEGKWLVERNKIDKYEFCDFLKEKFKDNSEINGRNSRDYYIDECFNLNIIVKNIILMDDDNGLENWDNIECNSFKEAIDTIDGGFGIIEYKEVG